MDNQNAAWRGHSEVVLDGRLPPAMKVSTFEGEIQSIASTELETDHLIGSLSDIH